MKHILKEIVEVLLSLILAPFVILLAIGVLAFLIVAITICSPVLFVITAGVLYILIGAFKEIER